MPVPPKSRPSLACNAVGAIASRRRGYPTDAEAIDDNAADPIESGPRRSSLLRLDAERILP